MDFGPDIMRPWKAMMAAGEDLPWWQDFFVKLLSGLHRGGPLAAVP